MYVCTLPIFFFFNDTATTEIYTLSLHDALPIYVAEVHVEDLPARAEVADHVEDLIARPFEHFRDGALAEIEAMIRARDDVDETLEALDGAEHGLATLEPPPPRQPRIPWMTRHAHLVLVSAPAH